MRGGGGLTKIIVSANVEFSVAHFEIGNYEGEIDEDGWIEIEGPCSCGHLASVGFSVDDLQEIVEAAKKFRDKRTAYRERGD